MGNLHEQLLNVGIFYNGEYMFDYFCDLSPVWQALIASLCTWAITSLGAAIVFFFKEIKKSIMDAMLGFSAGVMVSAAFWSLLSPAIEMAKSLEMCAWFVVCSGFMLGGILLFTGDKLYSHFDKKNRHTKLKRVLMLIFSITLHNIPEGLVIGVAFGSVAFGAPGATIIAAITLAIGIGIQNFPEGSAISLPLRREGYSRKKSFLLGCLSGIVEPISAVVGAILVLKVNNILPLLLSFAAGAMIYVVVEELIPESQTNKKKDLMALFTLMGFVIMMVLELTLS